MSDLVSGLVTYLKISGAFDDIPTRDGFCDWADVATARDEVLRLLVQFSSSRAEVIDRAAARITELEAENARLREALGNCVSTFKLVERPSFEDPLHGRAVRELGERIGYGALMSSASAAWRKSAETNGYPPGGEFVAGPCFTTVVDTLRRARAALAGQGDSHE